MILINEESKPVLVEVPQKPKHSYGASRSWEELDYKSKIDRVISDNSKHIQFKEPDKVLAALFWESRYIGKTCPIPDGLKVVFEDDCILNECNCPNPAKDGHIKLAILSKLEEERPLFFTEKLCDMHQRPACAPNERVDCKCEWIAFERQKVVAPSEEVKLNLYDELKNWLLSVMKSSWVKVTKDDGQYFAINDGKRYVAYNHDIKFCKTWFGIREDGDTRTVFNGTVETLADAKRIWELTTSNSH